MKMHVYAFGSLCRGEIDRGSDIDLLACVNGPTPNIDPEKYSIYRYERLQSLWKEGNPFSWHLHLESRMVFTSDGTDFLRDLGNPKRYCSFASDAAKFRVLFDRSYQALRRSSNSATFHLSCVFLAIRNFATCHSLSLGAPIFSRRSPLMVNPKLDIDLRAFSILTRARLLSTRGYGQNILRDEVTVATNGVANVSDWMEALGSQQSS